MQYGCTARDWQRQFSYDRYGNRSMQTGSSQTFGQNTGQTQGLIGPDPAVSTTTNRITNKTGEQYQFDASGNMTKDAQGNRSVFDVENHQTEYYYSTNSGSTPDAKYYYDGDGKRIKKIVGTETTIFVYDAGGKMAAEYTLGGAANPNPQTSYLTTDALGSLRVATDAAGHIIARHDYLPFGDEILGLGARTSAQGYGQPDTTRQRFTGYEKDTESGLDFAQARYFGNGLGRFTSVDPSIESIYPILPQTWNRYSYCLNDPLNLIDPSGLNPHGKWYMPDRPNLPDQDNLKHAHFVADGETLPNDGCTYHELPDGFVYEWTDERGTTEILHRDGWEEFVGYRTDPPDDSASVSVPHPSDYLYDEQLSNEMARYTPALQHSMEIMFEADMTIVTGFSTLGSGSITTLGLNNGVEDGALVEEGIYQFTARSGKTYVGQSGNITQRIAQHLRSGLLRPEHLETVERTAVSGGKTAREIAEQLRINSFGGVKNLENIRNPLSVARRIFYGIPVLK